MNPALQRYLEAASGLTALTAAKAEKVVKGLVKSGEAASDQVGDLVEDLMDRQRRNRESVSALVRSETNRAVHAMGLATSREVERLQKQVADLKREVSRLERVAAGGDASAATKATGKRATKRAGKKGTAKKSTAKKSTAKKSTAKKSSRKKATRKSTGQGGGGS